MSKYIIAPPLFEGYPDVIIKDDVMAIPIDPANTDYQQYLAWLAEGNEPEEWNPNAAE